MALRDKILNADDIPEEFLEIPEWKCTVNVRGLSGEERAELLQNNMLPNGRPNLKNLYPMISILCLRDPDTRDAIFHPADRDFLNKKSGAVLERIALVALRLSGLDANAQRELEKNFGVQSQSEDSTLKLPVR